MDYKTLTEKYEELKNELIDKNIEILDLNQELKTKNKTIEKLKKELKDTQLLLGGILEERDKK